MRPLPRMAGNRDRCAVPCTMASPRSLIVAVCISTLHVATFTWQRCRKQLSCCKLANREQAA